MCSHPLEILLPSFSLLRMEFCVFHILGKFSITEPQLQQPRVDIFVVVLRYKSDITLATSNWRSFYLSLQVLGLHVCNHPTWPVRDIVQDRWVPPCILHQSVVPQVKSLGAGICQSNNRTLGVDIQAAALQPPVSWRTFLEKKRSE